MRNTGWLSWCAGLLALSAFAGGGPQNVLLVVNDGSLESLELGQYYRARRGLPGINVCHINAPTNYSIAYADFTNTIQAPIWNYIANSGISNQIDYIALSRDIPYRVAQGASTNGVTAVLFYGFRTNAPAYCSFPANYSRSDWFEAEQSFTHSSGPSSGRYYLATILTATNLAATERMIDRAVAADRTQPTGTVFFYHPAPELRNVQWFQYARADFLARFLDIPQQRIFYDGYFFSPVTNAMGVMVGQPGGNGVDSMQFFTTTYATGALADHLTSFGGVLYEDSGQESVLRWVDAGAVGTYGTVLEPCAYTNKFPNARLHYWYGRGFNMAESYWMSVRNPYEGVFIGDPLCQPYARASQVAVAGLASNAVVSNTVNLTVTVVAAGSNRPVNEVRLYLDEFYLATLTNITPRAGNDVTVRINGNARTYTAPAGATLLTVATGLAARINAAPSLGVTARAVADRVEIVQDALGVAGTGLTCSAISSNNSSGELTVFPFVPFTNFLETTAAAYEQVTLSGAPAVGDIVRAVVTRLDGVKITNQVMAQAGDDAYTLLTNLAGVVNANTNLQSTSGCEVKWTTYNLFIAGGYDTYFVSRTNTWQGYNLYLNFSLSLQPGSTLSGGVADNFNFNADVLGARATIFLAAGRTNFACGYTLVTTNLADGPHTLRAVACEGTAVKAQGQTVIPFQVDNHGDQCVITNPAVGATFLLSESIPVQVWAAPAGGAITAVQFHAEAKRAAATNAAPYTCTLAASQYGVGELQLFARAFNSNGRVVDSLPVGVTILPDYDFDGLEDQWEIRNFGSIAVYNGTNDPDSDTFNNWLEYTADTEPTNAASYFRITAVGGPWTGALPRLTFVSSTAREYRIHCNDIALTSALYWLAASNVFMGAAGLTTWVDDGSDLPPLGGDRRYYRVRVRRP